MPDTFTLIADVKCPICNHNLLSSSRFQWGEVPGRSYKTSDSVHWLRDELNKIVQPFKLRKVGENLWRWNCGDPMVVRAVLLDEDIYTGNHVLICDVCGTEISAIASYVDHNFVVKVEALSKTQLNILFGKSVGKANIAIFCGDQLIPKEDWYDHTIEAVDV